MTDVSAGFRPPCWCPSRWAPAWRLRTNLYKFGENVSPHIFHKKNCCDLNLGESLNTSTFFLFPDSRLNLLNGFYFLLDLFGMAWHWKPAIKSWKKPQKVFPVRFGALIGRPGDLMKNLETPGKTKWVGRYHCLLSLAINGNIKVRDLQYTKLTKTMVKQRINSEV